MGLLIGREALERKRQVLAAKAAGGDRNAASELDGVIFRLQQFERMEAETRRKEEWAEARRRETAENQREHAEQEFREKQLDALAAARRQQEEQTEEQRLSLSTVYLLATKAHQRLQRQAENNVRRQRTAVLHKYKASKDAFEREWLARKNEWPQGPMLDDEIEELLRWRRVVEPWDSFQDVSRLRTSLENLNKPKIVLPKPDFERCLLIESSHADSANYPGLGQLPTIEEALQDNFIEQLVDGDEKSIQRVLDEPWIVYSSLKAERLNIQRHASAKYYGRVRNISLLGLVLSMGFLLVLLLTAYKLFLGPLFFPAEVAKIERTPAAGSDELPPSRTSQPISMPPQAVPAITSLEQGELAPPSPPQTAAPTQDVPSLSPEAGTAPEAIASVQAVILALTFVGVVGTTDSLYAFLASRASAWLRRPRTMLWSKRMGGAVLIGAGAATAMTRR